MENFKEILKSRTAWIIVLLIVAAIVIFTMVRKRKRDDEQSGFAEKVREDAVKDKVTEKEHQLNQHMRQLWGENTIWMRNYMVSYMGGHSDMKDVTKKLLGNQIAIGRSLGLWFSEEKGKQIGTLLQKNLISYGDVLKEMMDKNKKGALLAERTWYDNTDKLVDFLVSINPDWDKIELGQNFKKYNEMNISEAANRYNRKHEDEIVAFDKAHNHAMHDLADYISSGIVKHFPEKFDKTKK